MSNIDLFMPLYVGRYLGDTGHLTTLQHGAYMLLLMHYWSNGPLPDNDTVLATIARLDLKTWRKSVGPAVREFFRLIDGKLCQKRADAERSKAQDISSKRRDAANARHHGAGQPSAPSTYQPRTEAEIRAKRLEDGRKRGTHTDAEWHALLDACGGRCVKCGGTHTTKDHILPLYLGGSDAIGNIQPLCLNCNSQKGPNVTDYRPHDWRERCKCNANGQLMQSTSTTSAVQEQVPIPTTKKEYKILGEEMRASARETVPERPETSAPVAELSAAIAKRMFSNYPPRAPKLTAAQQIDAVAPAARPKTAHLTREQINAALRRTA